MQVEKLFNPETKVHNDVFAERLPLGPEFGFRPGTPVVQAPVSFLLNAAGMGDYINYSAAIVWIAENAPWIEGTLYVNSFLVELLSLVLRPYPRWSVKSGDGPLRIEHGMSVIGPNMQMDNGMIYNQQLLNATGSHLMDLGFAYYANLNAAPDGVFLPKVALPKHKVPSALRDIPYKYIVFTPGALTPSRMTYGKHLNPLIRFVKEKGFLPVFLGKDENHSVAVQPKFADDVAYSEGLDLRNKTTVVQAAATMEKAACVLGLDNGLLHLAALTDSRLIFGYNITSVAHREPRRNWGKTINMTVPAEKLPCIGCQSKMKVMIGHSFHHCLYGDNLCVDLLFADEGQAWKDAINDCLSELPQEAVVK